MDFPRIDALVDSLMEKYGVRGAEVLVYADHKLAYRRSVGHSDAAGTRPVSPDDMYIVYSMSKVFTNTAVARLLERGLLSLDDEVRKFLPEFGSMQVKEGDGVRPAQRQITIRDLMTMTAGLTYDLDTPPIKAQLEKDPHSTTRDMMPAIAAQPLLFEPSTHYNYSLCHDVLGAVIEVVTGKTFAQYMQDEIFDPLGMDGITFHPTEAQKARLTAQYVYDEPNRTCIEVPTTCLYNFGSDRYDSGGAGIHATADACMRFASVLAEGGTAENGYVLLKKETIDMMRAGNYHCPEAEADFHKDPRWAGYSYSLGVRAMMSPAENGLHTPRGEYGWDGAANAYMSIHPDCGVAIIFAVQILGFGPGYHEIHPQLREGVYMDLGY